VTDDKRLIEDYLPIQDISAEASREKSIRKGHISTLHLWWARRPLVACRAAVYASLVPSARFRPENGPEDKRSSLTRANAAKFVKALCTYPGSPTVIADAQKHILEAHAERLSKDGRSVTPEDIVAGRASRPRVLDMFAGGGAIPLEAARLGCEAYALDVNPVAHFVELCTLVLPQEFGLPDTGVKGISANGTWAGLAEEVRYWSERVLTKVKADIGDLYPEYPDPQPHKSKKESNGHLWPKPQDGQQRGLKPVAYLWTRTVKCKNPACAAEVPLVRQTWLRKKAGSYVGAKVVTKRDGRRACFEIVHSPTLSALGFDPQAGSTRGNAICPFCGTVADTDYIRGEGTADRLGVQLIAVACAKEGATGKVYVSGADAELLLPASRDVESRIQALCQKERVSIPEEPLPKSGTLGFRIQPYGIKQWGQLFTRRQILCLLSFVAAVSHVEREMGEAGYGKKHALAVLSLIAALVDRLASFSSAQCVWLCIEGERTANTFGRHALPMVWDFAEVAPFNEENAGWPTGIERVTAAIESAAQVGRIANVVRGSATKLPWEEGSMDAVITDPPYYDNVPYADLSDFFYVWLKRTIGHHYPEHFANLLTPKKDEAVAEPVRHGGSAEKARVFYEDMMASAFSEASRVLKANGQIVVVYAHKATLGWATLVDALRTAGFTVTEAWPLDTEKPGRLRAQQSAALASSIFLVGRKRRGKEIGSYDHEVRPELDAIVRERVASLWDLGVSGADLVIASIGAGLRAFTRFAKVEYANGDEVPAKGFLTEVETVVLETILARLSKEVGGSGEKHGLASADSPTRFYTLWRYTYKSTELDAGEAIIFANGTHVELDGLHGLAHGSRPLVEKKKSKYRLLDYSERGGDPRLGMPSEDGNPAPLIDALQRLLWLMEKHPSQVSEFLREARPNAEQMRLVAQALAGPALKGGEMGEVASGTELAALGKLTANWRSVVEDIGTAAKEREDRRTGQSKLRFEKGDRR
jgi:putative DNA methylase